MAKHLIDIAELAYSVLPRYKLEGGKLTLLSHSENTIYLVESDCSKFILRIHRPNYHNITAIESELCWMDSVRNNSDIITPEIITGIDGKPVQIAFSETLSSQRYCVLFTFLEGSEPDDTDLIESFYQLGTVSGKLHFHSRNWVLPENFTRQTWDLEAMFGAQPIWGDWKESPSITQERVQVIDRALQMIYDKLEIYGQSKNNFGLIHADLRLANLLDHNGSIRLIDFDDCGFGWYLYDFATALTFLETRTDLSDLVMAWLNGYKQHIDLSEIDEAEISTFMMMRRILVIAWINSHSETELAKEMGEIFTLDSCELAEKYLSVKSIL